jgi:hypothetical protein
MQSFWMLQQGGGPAQWTGRYDNLESTVVLSVLMESYVNWPPFLPATLRSTHHSKSTDYPNQRDQRRVGLSKTSDDVRQIAN